MKKVTKHEKKFLIIYGIILWIILWIIIGWWCVFYYLNQLEQWESISYHVDEIWEMDKYFSDNKDDTIYIFPDSAEITIDSPILSWEATNLGITIYKDWEKMTNYERMIYMEIVDEEWRRLSDNDHTLPWKWIYKFIASDQWHKEFQKWLEINKEWTFYIQVQDLIDPDLDKILWRQKIIVVK